MKKLFAIALLVLIAAGLVALVGFGAPASDPAAGKLRVTASFYPMGEFARQVGGDHVSVTVLVRPGTEPHDYDPTPADIVGVHKSKVLVYNGAGLEPWAEKIAPELQKNGVTVAAASTGIVLKSKDAVLAAEDPTDAAGYDPHVWLDPILAAQEVANIKAAFMAADPAHAADYERNAAAYIQELSRLDQNFRTSLAQCTRHSVITAHQALGYLSARYGFTALGISGLSPDEEPSPQKLAEVAAFARTNGVKYIFFETLTSPKLSQTIASEVGAQTIVFNPLEGLSPAQISSGANYLTVQAQNLDNLKIALDCK